MSYLLANGKGSLNHAKNLVKYECGDGRVPPVPEGKKVGRCVWHMPGSAYRSKKPMLWHANSDVLHRLLLFGKHARTGGVAHCH